MLSIVQERVLTEEQLEQMELQKAVPEKFNPEIDYSSYGRSIEPRTVKYAYFTPEECLSLIQESSASKAEEKDAPFRVNYSTYAPEEVQRILSEEYRWDTTKTTESGTKIRHTTKHSKHTKRSKK